MIKSGWEKVWPVFRPSSTSWRHLQHDVFGYRQHPLSEHRPNFVEQPIVQFGAPVEVCDALYSEPDFSKRDGAEIQKLQRLFFDEGNNFPLRSGPPQLRDDVGVEKPTRHRLTSRTRGRTRLGSISISGYGDERHASTKARPESVPLRRRNSSSETTTTSSRPCTVTCCGPSRRATRTSSLNRALASCSRQRPGRGFAECPARSFPCREPGMLTRFARCQSRWQGLLSAAIMRIACRPRRSRGKVHPM